MKTLNHMKYHGNRKRLVVFVAYGLMGIFYHSLFFNFGFNYGDEGSAALLGLRILEGEKPFIDLAMGYGLLWFLPITGLFAAFGPNFLVMKVYFHVLAVIMGLIAYPLLTQIIRRQWLALLAASLVILVPGVIHKVYIPFLVIANAYMALRIARESIPSARIALFSGVMLGLTFLIRPELGYLFFVLIIFVSVAVIVRSEGSIVSRIRVFLVLLVQIMSGIAAVYLPIVLLAVAGGYIVEFLEFNINFLKTGLLYISSTTNQGAEMSLLPRAGWDELLAGGRLSFLAIATYFLPIAFLFAGMNLMYRMFLKGQLIQNIVSQSFLTEFVIIYASAIAFLPFYFFRPDFAHLSQFMPGFILLSAMYINIGLGDLRWWKAFTTNLHQSGLRVGFIFVLMVFIIYYIIVSIATPGNGSISIRIGNKAYFTGENGVEVYVSDAAKIRLQNISRFVASNTTDGEYVLCLPYCPGFNFMTGRATYAKHMYVDENLPLFDPDWQSRAIMELREHRPKVILISDVRFNKNPCSRFSTWADEVYSYISLHYTYHGKTSGFHTYKLE